MKAPARQERPRRPAYVPAPTEYHPEFARLAGEVRAFIVNGASPADVAILIRSKRPSMPDQDLWHIDAWLAELDDFGPDWPTRKEHGFYLMPDGRRVAYGVPRQTAVQSFYDADPVAQPTD